MIDGKVGEYAVFARKERGQPTWFMGGITDETERRLTLPLSFLEAGKKYRAEIYRDGDAADFRTNPREIVIERRTVTAADTMPIRIAPGGGFAIRFVRLGR
ncbi:glycoside hydrolase family 97 C-terminal domain-containing protein [Sphingomonas sp. KRR8]|nr:glycoside hydrolase family 97 C-terminal domain-containing protein [Sphingomonas sp. KRR8]